MVRKKREIIDEESSLLKDAEKDFTESNEIEGEKQTESHKLIDLINAINNTLFGKEIEQKSKLSQKNIRGIIKGKAFVAYANSEYNFDFDLITLLCKDKLLLSKSHNGYAFEKSVEAMKNLSTSIEMTDLRPRDLNDRMAGVNR